jgi:hypothetical protein
MRRSFELLVVLAVLLGAFHWLSERHERKAETLAAAVEAGAASTLPPVVMPPMRSAETPPPSPEQPEPKKHFWQRSKEAAPPEPLEATEETVPDERPRSKRAEFGLPLPDAHFSGVKLIVWESGCPRCEKAVHDCEDYCRQNRFTIGDNPGCDVWVIRVPRESEPRRPIFQFFYDGRRIPPDMTGYGGKGQLRFVFARVPRLRPDWYREPVDGGASDGHSAPNYGPNYGPGLGIRYRSNTDVGVGLGCGPSWSTAPCGGHP